MTSKSVRLWFILAVAATAATPAFAQRWTFSLGGAYGGGYKIGSAPYSQTLPGAYVSLSDSGSISATAKNSGGGMFGVMYSFSKNWGLRLQVAYLSPAPVNFTSTYALSWTFATTDNTGTYQITRRMANTGDLSAITFHLELVWTIALGKSTFLHLGAGTSTASAKMRWYSDLGSGVSWSGLVDDLKWKFAGSSTWNKTTKSAAVVDYFLLKARFEEELNGTGFNVSLELEQKISNKLGIFLGASYSAIAESEETEARWSVDYPALNSLGVFGNLDFPSVAPVLPASPITSMVNFSHFVAVAGLKLHL